MVTKRIKALQIDGRTVHQVGVPIHWGFLGAAKPGYIANTLTNAIGDGNSQTPESKCILVKVEKVEETRHVTAIAGHHPPLGHHHALAGGAWCAHRPGRQADRFVDGDEVPRVRGREGQAGMADPQGRLHALQRSGLPEGLPVAGRDHPVRQRHRRFPGRELHWLRLLRHRLPGRRPAHFQEGPQGLQVHAVLGPRGGGPGAGLREDLPDRCDHLRQQAGDDRACRRPRRGPQITRLRERRPV
ncbi:hypothetical protein G6F65_016847 [Rhizopus arrhizus]|nr:hypothetical protein G6F65_016847 [Rhizopus arrhizus]